MISIFGKWFLMTKKEKELVDKLEKAARVQMFCLQRRDCNNVSLERDANNKQWILRVKVNEDDLAAIKRFNKFVNYPYGNITQRVGDIEDVLDWVLSDV